MTVVFVELLVLLVLFGALNAAQQSREKKNPTVDEVVKKCVEIVRKETNDRLGFKFSQFDAYIKRDKTVDFIGTAKERFSFEKCMDDSEYPLK